LAGVAFFDLEVAQPKIRISSIGALYQEHTWRGTSIRDFEIFTQSATYLCGHNIFAHDLPVLEKAGVSASFLGKDFIDTLQLSPLFFPNKPYHRLIKDYRLVSDYLNDPVADSRLAQEVLADCLEAWYQLPDELQFIFAGLLKAERNFSAFFKLVQESSAPWPESFDLPATIARCFLGKVCQHADLNGLIRERPVQLAYVLSLLHAPDGSSIIPPWLLYTYPVLPEIIHQLRANPCHQPECPYCRQYASPVAGLKRFFGYEGFRKFSPKEETPLQQAEANP
jgi:ATP-dependent DNA helicase RecQ